MIYLSALFREVQIINSTARFHLLDSLRGIAVISMIIYHLAWDLIFIAKLPLGSFDSVANGMWQLSICLTFILISGFCYGLARHPFKNGIVTLVCGIAVTVTTLVATPDSPIYFGVLFFLGAAMLILLPIRKLLAKVQPLIGLAVSILLFLLFYSISDGSLCFGALRLPEGLYRNMFTAFFGFCYPDFYSADYYSFFPWIFLFVSGFFLCSLVKKLQEPPKFLYFKIPVFEWIGRHALIIYLAHQPILYGITLLIIKIQGA